MKAIDGLLSIMVRQEASELRLASNKPPRLLRGSEEVPLTMPATTPAALETLLGDLPTEPELAERGATSFPYSNDTGEFDIGVSRRPGNDLDVRIVRRRGAPSAPAPKPAPATPRATATTVAAATAPVLIEAPELPPAIAALIQQAGAARASDVHLTEGKPPVLRVDGELRVLDEVEAPDLSALLDPARLERVLGGHSVDLGYDLEGVGRLRVNVYGANDGLSVAIRLLTRDAPRLSTLRLPSVVESLIQLPHGLVIICGPTGSGKSTTLAALAQEAMRTRAQVLITLEDPIEYRIPPGKPGGLVRQREVRRHVSDFATGLRDALREDPDTLLIGEMRDVETINLALTAAETGHLVFASLHSRSSASAIERIVDTYPPERQRQIRVQLADALRAVISQRLVPRIGGGRVAAVEFLRVHAGVANLIREGKTPQIISSMQAGGDDGMVQLERTLADLVRNETVTHAAARAVASDPQMLDYYLGARK